jgi:hypothetical protein
VTVSGGIPVIAVRVGTLATGQPVTIEAASYAYLEDLEESVRVAKGRLSFWVQSHSAHPFGEVA